MRTALTCGNRFLLPAFHALFQAWHSQLSEEADGGWWICDLPTTVTQLYGALNHPKDKNQKQSFGACQN